jgi:hypothetical protein
MNRQQTLPELSESEATGTIAEIYEEIRVYCGVPYVSSMQRHLATRPGVLEWAWAALLPAVVDGTIPETAWRLAGQLHVEPLPPLTRPALRLLGVDEVGEMAIQAICDTFIRVSPINLLFGGVLRRLLEGEQPGGSGAQPASPWTPPPMLPAGPPLLDAAVLAPDHRAVLLQFETGIGSVVFVPGLYRMLAHWPAYLAHVATLLGPRFTEPATKQACDALATRVDAAAPDVLAALPSLPSNLSPPSPEEAAEIVTAILRYRGTSPEMVVFSTLLRDALLG